jgi:hypothetical protein
MWILIRGTGANLVNLIIFSTFNFFRLLSMLSRKRVQIACLIPFPYNWQVFLCNGDISNDMDYKNNDRFENDSSALIVF